MKNFKVFQDVTISGIRPYSVFVGANGTGKTTLFGVFGFLRDCLKDNVRSALAKLGGFREVVSRGHESETILIELKIRMDLSIGSRVVTYIVEIGLGSGAPIVAKETLRYTRYGGGKPFDFIRFAEGTGSAIRNEGLLTEKSSLEEREEQKLDSPDILAIKGLGQFERFEAASAFRRLIENWHVSDFHISAARSSQDAGYAEHLSPEGENLPLVTQYLFENHRNEFDKILKAMERRVPGVRNVSAEQTQDGRVVLRFQDGSFKDPFVARYVSDGTIKMFAYLTLLHDPKPHPLLCIEEPENQLYPSLLRELSEEFMSYASKGGGQVFVSTHSPDYLNAVEVDSIFVLRKKGGFTEVQRATDFPQIPEMVAAGDLPGALWRQRMFEGADPQ
ncbi:MAG: AAA family ATPase [Methylocystis sp.]